MTDYKDLIERLRNDDLLSTRHEAADALEAQEKANKWLKENALFACQVQGCAAEVCYHYDMLAMHEGKPICQECYEWDMSTKDSPNWHDLPLFTPFTTTRG